MNVRINVRVVIAEFAWLGRKAAAEGSERAQVIM
jgi:hypothetical protein